MSTKNMTREQEKIAVVTGSSSGIGYETSLCYNEASLMLQQLGVVPS
jgi:NADP-dependent 3-hydroxy acid dehydrogenase YdfG